MHTDHIYMYIHTGHMYTNQIHTDLIYPDHTYADADDDVVDPDEHFHSTTERIWTFLHLARDRGTNVVMGQRRPGSFRVYMTCMRPKKHWHHHDHLVEMISM